MSLLHDFGDLLGFLITLIQRLLDAEGFLHSLLCGESIFRKSLALLHFLEVLGELIQCLGRLFLGLGGVLQRLRLLPRSLLGLSGLLEVLRNLRCLLADLGHADIGSARHLAVRFLLEVCGIGSWRRAA